MEESDHFGKKNGRKVRMEQGKKHNPVAGPAIVPVSEKVRNAVKTRRVALNEGLLFQNDPYFTSTVLDTVTALIVVLDNAGHIVVFNKACEKVTGYSFEEVKGKYFGDIFIIENERKEVLKVFKKLVEGNFPNSYENYWKCKSGDLCRISWSNNVLIADGGEVEYIIGCGTDITQKTKVQKLLEENQLQIKKNEKLLKEISYSMPGVVFQLSMDKTGGLSFNYVSESIYEICGLTPNQVYELKQSFFENIHPEDNSKFRRSILTSAKSFSKWMTELRFKHFTNSEFSWFKIYATPKLGDGGNVIWNGTIANISCEKEMEQKLYDQNQELTKINQELDRFVYSTSHDLRAPLTSVLGLLNLIKEESKEPEVLTYAQLAEKSINKFERIIRNILEYSRNKRSFVEIETISFKNLIEEILENYEYSEEFKKVRKIIAVNQETTFYSDRRRVKVVLENILFNALKYTSSEKDPFVEVKVEVRANEVQILISDNGIGISEEVLPKIFDMFYRATEKSDGSGLGLYIVEEALKRLMGKIEVQSLVNKGSTFKITIPGQPKPPEYWGA